MRLVCILALLLTSCASILEPPYRACLRSQSNPRLFSTGTVIAEKDDGSLLFQYDDRSAGDQGFQWVKEKDRISRCVAASPFDVRSPDGGPELRADDPRFH